MKNFMALMILALLVSVFCACNQDEDKLLLTANKLFCKRQLLTDSSRVLWEDIARHIRINLDKDVDSLTRKHILSMNSVPMLESFEDFQKFPDSVKERVHKAGEIDKRLVDEIAEVSFSLDSLEVKKLKFLKKVGINSLRGKNFLNQYNEYIASPCTFTSTN